MIYVSKLFFRRTASGNYMALWDGDRFAYISKATERKGWEVIHFNEDDEDVFETLEEAFNSVAHVREV